MYGLVNKAVRDLVLMRFGKDRWDEIKTKAGVNGDTFVGMSPYPDEVTYRLVAAASETLGLSPEQVLEAFGEHWIGYTAQEGYGAMLDLAGDNFVDFLKNLDKLHARVGLSFPKLAPPSFRCTDVTEGSVRLHYYSKRPGLAPFVVGLLKGLGKRFKVELDVSVDKSRDNGHDHDEFLIRFQNA